MGREGAQNQDLAAVMPVIRIALAVAVLVILGLPITELWKVGVLVPAWLALAYGTVRPSRARLIWALAIAAGAVAARTSLPVAGIEEGHNIFLVTHDTGVLEKAIPPAIFRAWRHAFERQYPLAADPDAAWHRASPTTPYASSSDALWRRARYSRQVDTIDFASLGGFRGGFANDTRYNFFGSDALSLTRGFQADLPFYVMYEWSPWSVGSTLRWRGTLFWERPDGSFDEIVHREESGRDIAPSDVGRRVYGLHLPAALAERPWEVGVGEVLPPEGLSIHLALSRSLMVAHYARQVLSIVGVLAILLLLSTVDIRRFAVAVVLTSVGAVVVAAVIGVSDGKYLGPAYPPHGGGDDGLTHESMGRTMAGAFMSGRWAEALRGEQAIYWETPGMRYARFVERIVFGDTNLGYAAFVALLPWFVYLLLSRLIGIRWALAGCLFLVASPLGSLSLLQYVMNAKLGYAEAMAFGFFVLGTYLFVRSQPAWGGQRAAAAAFFGGMCLAGSMFLRPNLALAVPLLGTLFLVRCGWSRDLKTMLGGAAGLAFALWMPLHNYLYGHEFVLISAAGATGSVPLGPSTYGSALLQLVGAAAGDDAVAIVARQLSEWLLTLPRLPAASLKPIAQAFMVLNLVTLAVTLFVALRCWRYEGFLPILAWAALAAHMPMLFVFAPGQFRYGMIAWDLSAIVTLAFLASHVRWKSEAVRQTFAATA